MVYTDDDKLMSSTVPPLMGVAKDYKATLDSIMSFVHGVDFGKNRQYTKGELRALTPKDIMRWMNFMTFDDVIGLSQMYNW